MEHTTTRFIQAVSQDLGLNEQSSYPWLPLPTEQLQDYMAFELWRNLGANRPAQAHKLAKDNKWAARALAYDEYMALQSKPVREQADQIAKTIMTSANMAMQAIQLELVKALRNMGSTQASTMTVPEMVSAIEKIAKTSRLLAGESTENVAVVGKIDLSNLSDEELEQAEALRIKATIG